MEDAITPPDINPEDLDDTALLNVVDTVQAVLGQWKLSVHGSADLIETWLNDEVLPECYRRGLYEDTL